MTVTIQSDDYATDGALSSSTYGTGVADFTALNGRAYSTGIVATATYETTLTAFDPGTLLSASTPKRIRYEIDFRLPDTLPPSGELVAGFTALARSTGRDGLRLVYRRTSGGAATYVELLLARATGSALADLSLYLVPVTALAASSVSRLRLDVTLNAGNVVAVAYLNDVQAFTSTPSLAQFNLVTGRTLTAMTSATLYARLVVTVTGTGAAARCFLDRLRVTDWGDLADEPAFAVEPSLTPALTRTPITPEAEDDGTVATLSVHPSFAVEISDDWATVDHPFDSGHTATHPRQSRRRRSFSLRWDALNSSDLASLQALRGSAPFTWTPRDTGVALRLQWTSDLAEHHVGPSVWAAEATAREVLSGA